MMMIRALKVRVARAALAGAVLFAPTILLPEFSSAGATTVPICPASALTIGVGVGGAAAGNLGFPVIITNHGSKACSLDGFAMVTAHTEAVSPHPVTFVHTSRSQIYTTAKAKPVIVGRNETASFGVSYVDALDQQYGEAPRCLMTSIAVRLPGVAPLSKPTISFTAHGATYQGTINVCFAGFKFGLTPIVKGSAPPYR